MGAQRGERTPISRHRRLRTSRRGAWDKLCGLEKEQEENM